MVPPLVIANAPLALSVPEPLMLPMVPLDALNVPFTVAEVAERTPLTFNVPPLTVSVVAVTVLVVPSVPPLTDRLVPLKLPIEEVVAEEL